MVGWQEGLLSEIETRHAQQNEANSTQAKDTLKREVIE